MTASVEGTATTVSQLRSLIVLLIGSLRWLSCTAPNFVPSGRRSAVQLTDCSLRCNPFPWFLKIPRQRALSRELEPRVRRQFEFVANLTAVGGKNRPIHNSLIKVFLVFGVWSRLATIGLCLWAVLSRSRHSDAASTFRAPYPF